MNNAILVLCLHDTIEIDIINYFYNDLFYIRYYRVVLAMVFAIEEINQTPDFLPNITLGFRIFDSCISEKQALRGTLELLSGKEGAVPGYSCSTHPLMAGIIGETLSSLTIPMARIMGVLHYPQISHSAAISTLSDKLQFPSFLRTVPGNTFQNIALAQLVGHFGWTWVGLIISDDDVGLQGGQQVKMLIEENGGCVAFIERIHLRYSMEKVWRVFEVIRRHSVKVVIIHSAEAQVKLLLETIYDQNITGKTWIFSAYFGISPGFFARQAWRILNGTLGLKPYTNTMSGFKDFLLKLHPDKFPDDIFLKHFFGKAFHCQWSEDNKDKTVGTIGQQLESCSGNKTMNEAAVSLFELYDLSYTYHSYLAVNAFAHALNALVSCRPGEGPFTNGACADISDIRPWQIHHYLKNQKFKSRAGQDIFFDERGDAPASFDILNIQISPDEEFRMIKVGKIDPNAPEGQKITLHVSSLVWSGGSSEISLTSINSKLNHLTEQLDRIKTRVDDHDSRPDRLEAHTSDMEDQRQGERVQFMQMEKVLEVIRNKNEDLEALSRPPAELPAEVVQAYFSEISLLWFEDAHRAYFNAPLSMEEVKAAIRDLSGDKAPDLDGLTPPFYKEYSDILAPHLMEVYAEAMKTGILPASLREALIVTILKPERTAFAHLPFLSFEGHIILTQQRHDSKELFSIVKELSNPSANVNNIPPSQELCDSPATSFHRKIADIHDSFNTMTTSTMPDSTSTNTTRTNRLTSWTNINDVETRKIMNSIHSGSPSDPCPHHIYNKADAASAPQLRKVINISFETGRFPESWKHAEINALPKEPKVDPKDLKNFRPISLLPFPAKVIKKIVNTQLNHHLEANDILDPFQSGFRRNQSTETTLLAATDDIRCQLDNGQISALILLDLSNAFDTVPRSVCSESCSPGYRKALQEGEPLCCFDCVPCSQGEISNDTDVLTCIQCPAVQWSNERHDQCIRKMIEFLSYEEPLGLTLAIVASAVALLTAGILCMFVKYRETPIIKASNRGLSYFLLFSLTLCFLCSLLFIGQPRKLSCMLRQTVFGIIFSISVSLVLAKTFIVVIAFKAANPNSHAKQWLGSKTPSCIVFFCSLVQVLLCVFWLLQSPPFPELNLKSYNEKITIECNEGDTIFFYCMLGYMGLLAAVSFIVAFLSRNLPGSFNEAKLITFSMLMFVSVWIAFIPAYLSTRGKYTVAVEVFAILCSSAGLLGCIFFPKCYIIVMRPGRNNRQHIIGKYSEQLLKDQVLPKQGSGHEMVVYIAVHQANMDLQEAQSQRLGEEFQLEEKQLVEERQVKEQELKMKKKKPPSADGLD
ncbi:vomeronasal type-2 receptor 26-like [Pleurodeles waltl]|uniref:vomeronasal type-2 receptor 26-like n=1 Tax=Pleurodeles waltl TaxID=8319 RepID=UPI003709C306